MPEVGPAVNYRGGQRSRKTNTNLYTFSFLTAYNVHCSARGREGRYPTLRSEITVGLQLLCDPVSVPHVASGHH